MAERLSADEIARMMTDPATCDVLEEDWLKDAIDSLLAQVAALQADGARLEWLDTAVSSGEFRRLLDATDSHVWTGSMRGLIDHLRAARFSRENASDG